MKLTQLSDRYWMQNTLLNEPQSDKVWSRYELFFRSGNKNTPIAEVDVVKHPGQDGYKPHHEIKINLRNNIRMISGQIEIDKNEKVLRHPNEIVPKEVLLALVEKLKEVGVVSLPLCYFIDTVHVETFEVQGDIFTDD